MNTEYIKKVSIKEFMVRGQFISNIALLEKTIDLELASYFASTDKKKSAELFALIFAGDLIPLGKKIQVLNVLLNKYKADFIVKNPTLIKDMVNLSEDRNIFAHYITNDSLSDEKVICFYKYKNTTQKNKKIMGHVSFTYNELALKNERIKEIVNLISYIFS